MFTLDIIALNLLKQLYNKIYPWPDNIFYGSGTYAKFAISLFVLQQCFFIVYSYKVKKKKGGESK